MKTTPPELHMLLAATAYLMTRYSLHASVSVAQSVAHHLEMLLTHPATQVSPAARSACQGLLLQWREIAARHTGAVCYRHADKTKRAH